MRRATDKGSWWVDRKRETFNECCGKKEKDCVCDFPLGMGGKRLSLGRRRGLACDRGREKRSTKTADKRQKPPAGHPRCTRKQRQKKEFGGNLNTKKKAGRNLRKRNRLVSDIKVSSLRHLHGEERLEKKGNEFRLRHFQ